MRLFLIGLLITLTACSRPPPELIGPYVPGGLRQPCSVAQRQRETMRDVVLTLSDYVEALDCANGRIAATNTILVDFEEKVIGGTPQ